MLLGDGATPDQLAERFRSLETASRPDGAAAMLARLASLGLVRVASAEGGQARYVLTALGQQYANGALGGQAEVEAQLSALERLRTDLLSTIAHELRTPLTAVRTAVGLLRDPGVNPDAADRERMLDTIARSAERMQRLVTDVLDLTRFRAGSLRLQARRFDAVTLARDAGAAVASLLQARRQHLDLHLPDAPIWVYGDRRRLEQVLAEPALERPQVLAGRGVDRAGGGRGRRRRALDGRRSGPGIAPEDRARLFERFFTVASDSGGSGAGLGLPIALAIAQAHGGTIDVESEPGRGSTFVVRVPIQGPAELGDL